MCFDYVTVLKAALLFQCHSDLQQHIKAHLHHLSVERQEQLRCQGVVGKRKKKITAAKIYLLFCCDLYGKKIIGEIGLLVAFGGFWRPLVMKDCTPCACTLSQQGLANVLSCLW